MPHDLLQETFEHRYIGTTVESIHTSGDDDVLNTLFWRSSYFFSDRDLLFSSRAIFLLIDETSAFLLFRINCSVSIILACRDSMSSNFRVKPALVFFNSMISDVDESSLADSVEISHNSTMNMDGTASSSKNVRPSIVRTSSGRKCRLHINPLPLYSPLVVNSSIHFSLNSISVGSLGIDVIWEIWKIYIIHDDEIISKNISTTFLKWKIFVLEYMYARIIGTTMIFTVLNRTILVILSFLCVHLACWRYNNKR